MKAWKESVSLILAARHVQNHIRSPTAPNYNLLYLKRQKKLKFMPGTYVFPGGVIESADAELKWYDLFKKFGFHENSFTSLLPNTNLRPQIFKSQPNELPREISLRISAIRETFEECGILLCRKAGQNSAPVNWAQCTLVSKEELLEWQEKVHNDVTNFYNLCTKLKCYPDVWSLYEWRNWLTPTFFKKRYNTVFYLAFISSIPNTNAETIEIESIKWDTPKNLLHLKDLSGLPQIYELAQFTNFGDINNLLESAMKISKVGIQHLYLPVKVRLQDGNSYVLPHDSMYPEQPSLVEEQIIDKLDMTMEEFQNISPAKNRATIFDLKIKRIIVDNIKNTYMDLSSTSVGTVNNKLNKK